MFTASSKEYLVTSETSQFIVSRWSEVLTTNGWKYADTLSAHDILVFSDDDLGAIESVVLLDNSIVIEYREGGDVHEKVD
jgi:hypothetical protein